MSSKPFYQIDLPGLPFAVLILQRGTRPFFISNQFLLTTSWPLFDRSAAMQAVTPSSLSGEKFAGSDSSVVKRDIAMLGPLVGIGSGVLSTYKGADGLRERMCEVGAFAGMTQRCI